MKLSIKSFAIIALLLSFNFAATAQRGEQGGMNADPAKMAEKQTARMVEKLSLDEVQAAKVKEINLTYAKKMHEVREEHKTNRSAVKEIGTAINAEKSADMKLVLTEAQFKSYEEMQAKQGERKGGHQGGRQGGRQGGGRHGF